MAFDKDAMIEELSKLTVLELVDLVEGLKDKWGVEAAAPAMAMAMPVADGGAGAADGGEQTEFTVSITSAGDKKLQVIKEARAITGLGLKEAKALVEEGGVVKEGIAKEEANEIKEKLEAVGATVEVK